MNTNLPLISIVVPAYNCEKYIGRCIQSILNQTYTNFELIIIDDGSTDNTSEICRKFLQIDNRIIYLKKKNGGVSSARNKGIAIAKGIYISFIDSDDYLDSDFIQNFGLEYNRVIDILSQGCVSEYNEKEAVINKFSKHGVVDKTSFMESMIETWLFTPPWGKLFSSKIIRDNNIFFNEKFSYAEDRIFNVYFLLKAKTFKLSDKIGYHYTHENPNALTKKNIKPEIIYDYVIEFRNILNLLLDDINLDLLCEIKAKHSYIYSFIGCVLDKVNSNDYSKEDKVKFLESLDSDIIHEASSYKSLPLKYKIVAFVLSRFNNNNIRINLIKSLSKINRV